MMTDYAIDDQAIGHDNDLAIDDYAIDEAQKPNTNSISTSLITKESKDSNAGETQNNNNLNTQQLSLAPDKSATVFNNNEAKEEKEIDVVYNHCTRILHFESFYYKI